jgi:hypothetical protein
VISVPLTFSVSITDSGKFILFLGLVTFFTGYSITEIVFTPIISSRVSSDNYGLNIGAYNTLQFMGQFAGGSVAGAVIGLNFSSSQMIKSILILETLIVISIVVLLAVKMHGNHGVNDRGRYKA